MEQRAACDVIVPVFDGFDAVARCLGALRRHTPEAHRVVLVDDASTDPRVRPLLREFAQRRPNCLVIEMPRNAGFVGAANRGLAEAKGDAVVLNSDTEVTAGWLEGMQRCRRSDPAIGIVCPLSNHATILTIEGAAELHRRADGTFDVDALGECVRRASARSYPRIPTAVGFCMLLTQELLDTVGSFDPAFGRGYGEENDLSMRALERGFQVACCDDVYVHHAGGASFAAVEGIAGSREANRVLLEGRWPNYAPSVERWWRRNPLRGAIERASAEAERQRSASRLRVLQVLHGFETLGGVEGHARALVEHLADEVAFTVLVPNPGPGGWPDFQVTRAAVHLRILSMNSAVASPSIRVNGVAASPGDEGVENAFRALLEGRFDVVHFQSPVGWNTLRLPRIAREAGAAVVIGVHDLSWMCADFNMVTGPRDRPCGKGTARAADAECVFCIHGKSDAMDARVTPPIGVYLERRFAAASDAMQAAHAIVCPSAYAAGRVKQAFGEGLAEKLRVIGHGVIDLLPVPHGAAGPALHVAFLGRFSRHKGGAVLVDAARRLAGERIAFEAWGPVHDGLAQPASAAGIALRGPYRTADLPAILSGVDLVIVPSLLEETFSLVAAEAQQLGLPVAASRIGALPERVTDGETGFLFPAGDVVAIAALLLRLRDDRALLEAVARRLCRARQKTHAANAREYLALYQAL